MLDGEPQPLLSQCSMCAVLYYVACSLVSLVCESRRASPSRAAVAGRVARRPVAARPRAARHRHLPCHASLDSQTPVYAVFQPAPADESARGTAEVGSWARDPAVGQGRADGGYFRGDQLGVTSRSGGHFSAAPGDHGLE